MKRKVETLTEAEQERVLVAFNAEQNRTLPWHWRRNAKFGEFYNADAYDNHRDGVRVFREVELHDDGNLWLHLSVSLRGLTKIRPPDWATMDKVKRQFVGDARAAYQVHPKRDDHYSENEVLHLWCPLDHTPIPDLRSIEGKL